MNNNLENDLGEKLGFFVQNIGFYNEGKIVGGWIYLPQNPNAITSFLREIVKIDEMKDEYEIADYSDCPFDYRTIQYCDLNELNNMAILYSTLSEEQQTIIDHYVSENNIDSLNEISNVIMQIDNISFFSYNFEGNENVPYISNEEKIGYVMAENSEIYEKLEELDIEIYFDFEKFGRDCLINQGITLYDDGYLIDNSNIDLEMLNVDEIKEIAKKTLENHMIEVDSNVTQSM